MSDFVRTQIYLPKTLYRQLKARGKILNKSLAEQIRDALKLYLASEEKMKPKSNTIWQIVGKASSGVGDLSKDHDKYLYGWSK